MVVPSPAFGRVNENASEKIKPGDLFVCYVTKISRWIGVLRILEGPFEDSSPIFYESNDPFVIRFKVEKLVWMDLESAIPIHQDFVWDGLSFTRDHTKTSSSWTAKLRTSLNEIPKEDDEFLVDLLKTHRVRTQTAEEVEAVVPDEDNDPGGNRRVCFDRSRVDSSSSAVGIDR